MSTGLRHHVAVLRYAADQLAVIACCCLHLLSQEYLPKIFDGKRVDRVMEIGQREAEETMRQVALFG